MKYFICILSFFLSFSALAEKRGWYYGTGLDGKAKEFHGTTDMHSRFLSKAPRSVSFWESRMSVIDRDLLAVKRNLKSEEDGPARNKLIDQRFKLINNKARCLINLKKIDEALQLLLKLEKAWEGESVVAENIATCYEFKKEYDKASEWISIAMRRNTMASYSNLWVYEKIIEARKEFAKDKNYFTENSVTGLLISQDKELKPIDLSRIENFQRRWKLAGKAKHIREQIKIQLELHNVSTDPVLAHLTEELGCIYAVNEVCEVALPVFEMAKSIGHPEPELIEGRIQQMIKLINANPKSMTYSRSIMEKLSNDMLMLIIAVGVFLLLLFYVWLTGKKRSVES